MAALPPEIDRLTHAVLSPLTTIHGTTQLLQRRLAGSNQAQVGLLLAVLERSVTRLRQTCELLLQDAALDADQIRIIIPAQFFSDEEARAAQIAWLAAAPPRPAPPAPHPPAEVVAGSILLIAGAQSAAEPLAAALLARGHTLVRAAGSAEGLDRARELRPALVLLDPAVDQQSELLLRILSEDPDTKAIALALLARVAPTDGVAPVALIDPQLPSETAAALIDALIAPGATARAARPHILIVDDEPDLAAMLAAQFEGEGFQTTQVYSGTAVLRLTREQQFDLILLDLMLPDLDGFTVLGGLRAQPKTQLTPIILVSAINSPAEKVRGLQLGADDYITKPFSTAELSARVVATMRRSEREGGANPSTRLPGNIAIERAISQRIAQGLSFVVCYCDIDNFKAYNDSYGFLKGDAVIQRTARILLDAVRAAGNPDDFVGHIGGDDFVLISTPERAVAICEVVMERFDATAPLFYDPRTRARGFLSGEDRQGRPAEFPLVSITITVVSSARQPFRHPGEVAQRSIEGKKRGKLIPGSIYLIEE
jgi:PleD family two-component response regulator